ncbi:hypothetical protein SAMN05216474_0255 [Lishizhenia tianjinensis]|uniref:Uncharacterized protein n=1 Tax=Lishizhenia tianjinensis TaxID=477690 RepID=A0A1I6XK63_9FLAO|nr:hypothetical protein [Lishizhenia tianjinensis]SFT38487.1 hypothetical protein SAMN05216474_0255 [Lishizhenia tianjinensis]
MSHLDYNLDEVLHELLSFLLVLKENENQGIKGDESLLRFKNDEGFRLELLKFLEAQFFIEEELDFYFLSIEYYEYSEHQLWSKLETDWFHTNFEDYKYLKEYHQHQVLLVNAENAEYELDDDEERVQVFQPEKRKSTFSKIFLLLLPLIIPMYLIQRSQDRRQEEYFYPRSNSPVYEIKSNGLELNEEQIRLMIDTIRKIENL